MTVSMAANSQFRSDSHRLLGRIVDGYVEIISYRIQEHRLKAKQ